MVVSVDLQITYKHPVRPGQKVKIHGRVDRKTGRKIFTIGEILLEDGTVAVTGTGIFIEAPQMFEKYGEEFQAFLNQEDSD